MNAEELIERLKKSFNAPSTKDERLKVVLVCVVISTTFWFFNALNQDNYTSQINYPIEWNFDAERFIPVEELPSRVPIEVIGGGWDLMTRSFGFNMRPIEIDLTDPASAKYLLTSQLRASFSRNLDPVSISFLIQDSLKYDIQPRVTRKFKLVLNDENITFDSDYRLMGEFQLSIDSIELEGPRSIIEGMPAEIMIEAEIENIDADVDEELSIPDLPDLVETKLESVSLNFDVLHYININENHIVELVNFPDTLWRVYPNELSIDYQIGESEFDTSDSSRVRLVADFNQLNKQDSTIMIEVIQGRELIESIRLPIDKVKAQKR